MGQAIGRAPLLPVARHYVNGAPRRRNRWRAVSRARARAIGRGARARPDSRAATHPPLAVPCTSMHHLWDAFNDIAEGFGLTSDEMCEILRVCLKDVLGYTEKKLDAISR